MNTLFQPYRLNDTLTLANRFMMAPLTRCMAGPGLVPTEQMAAYYARRAPTSDSSSPKPPSSGRTVRATPIPRGSTAPSRSPAGRK